MYSVSTKLFYFWLLLLPFGYQISGYTHVIEPDKALALVLLLLGVAVLFRSTTYRMNRVVSFMFLGVAYLVFKNLSLVGTEMFWDSIWNDSNKIAYFIVPLLFIDNMVTFRRVGWIVVFIAVVGCVSALLVSTGLITLPISVPIEYRISLLPRAKGLFLSTGNLAQYIAFAFAWVVVAPGIVDKKCNFLRIARWVFFVSLVMGLLATQSRNILLVLIISVFVLWAFNVSRSLSSSTKIVFFTGLCVVILIPLLVTILFYSSTVVNDVADAGGAYAKTSVDSRFVQYGVAWDIIKSHPFLGADAETFEKFGATTDHIHNMWLEILANGGIMTALVMVLLIMRLYRGVRSAIHVRDKSDVAIVIMIYMVAMLVAIMFYIGIDKMFWALFGITSAFTCIDTKVKIDKNDQVVSRILTKRVSRKSISKVVDHVT